MAKPKTNREGYQLVLDVISKSKLAKTLDLSRQAVGNWGPTVPEAYGYRVSIITGVPIEDILPEVAPEVHHKLKKLADEETKITQSR